MYVVPSCSSVLSEGITPSIFTLQEWLPGVVWFEITFAISNTRNFHFQSYLNSDYNLHSAKP